MRNDHRHQLRNPSSLTPAEQKIWSLHEKGLSRQEIVETLGLKSSPATMSARINVIRNKLRSSEAA